MRIPAWRCAIGITAALMLWLASTPATGATLASIHCKKCHAAIYRSWQGSNHAAAQRSIDASVDRRAFVPTRHITEGRITYAIGWKNGKPSFVETRPGTPPHDYVADYVIGRFPLRQYLVPAPGGRYQAFELAYDPVRNDWFDVFGAGKRHPGDWGYWQGRGMNWNSMCAPCHMTRYHRNYDPATDAYRSTWLEQGVGCVQCHGDITPAHLTQKYAEPAAAPPHRETARRMMQTCAPCHARNALLTGSIRPGGRYVDHYRLVLPVESGIFYADGQMQSEDYNYTSLLLSPMGGRAGVTCLDCHDPHSGKTLLPVNDNRLCLACHGTGRRGAPVIHPTAHSHHAAGSTGNRCIACHMSTTIYMQRDARHDHGFIRPDPLLTKELGIPNACNKCHTNKSADWAIRATNRWFGRKMSSRQRARARVVAAARRHEASVVPALAALIQREDIPAWKATLLLLARPWISSATLQREARHALSDDNALVRAAAVQTLGVLPGPQAELKPLLDDPVRLVRLDAEWALSPSLARGSKQRAELDASLMATADQPDGQARLGEDLFNRGRPKQAEAHLRRAAAWDPGSAAILASLATVVNARGASADAGELFWKAAAIDGDSAPLAFNAGLAFAAAGRRNAAERALEAATHRDPAFDRAWYDLGLLRVRSGRLQEGLAALEKAETLAPAVADYPYAIATVELQRGDSAAAAAAARRALAIDPHYAPARDLLNSLH